MPSILVRGLDQKTVQRLKERARLNGRSLQLEVTEILERAAGALTHERGATVVREVEAPTRQAIVLRQRAIDPRGSRFTMTLALGTRQAVAPHEAESQGTSRWSPEGCWRATVLTRRQKPTVTLDVVQASGSLGRATPDRAPS